MDLIIEPYSDKSFKISGDLTRNFKEDLKKYGGRFNPNLQGGPGWIFPNKTLSTLQSFVDQVNSGSIKPPTLPYSSSSTSTSTSSSSSSSSSSSRSSSSDKYVSVTYRVIKLTVGMRIMIIDEDIEEKKAVVKEVIRDDYVIVELDNRETTELQICNGQWKRKCCNFAIIKPIN